MRQAPLLELHDIYECMDLSKYVFFHQHLLKLLQLHPEHSRYKIWTVLWTLTRIKLILDLIPIRIARHCEEDIRFTKLSHQSYCIHVPTPHITGPSDESRR